MTNFKSILKAGYLYIVCGITIVMIIFSASTIVKNFITYNLLGIQQERWSETPELACSWKYVDKSELSADSTVAPSQYTYESLEDCIQKETEAQKQRAKIQYAYDMAEAVAMLLIALPLWIYHWSLIRKEQ